MVENANDWNETEYYKKEVIPLLNELVEKLEARKMPHVLSINYSSDSEGIGAGIVSNVFSDERGKTVHAANMISCASVLSGEDKFLIIPKLMIGSLSLLSSLLGNLSNDKEG